jgi:hypothetical protein
MNALRICTRALLVAAAGLIMIAATPARAVHLESFQLDGDVKETTCGGAFGTLSCPTAQPDDWDSLYSCPSSGTGACSKITAAGANLADVIGELVDEFNGPDPDNFGQGTKDDMNVTAWNWTAAGGSAKTNIMQSFAAKYDGSLYIGANRDINNGDANFGVWLLQNATAKCTAAMVTAGQCATAGTFVGKPNAQGFRSLVPHRIGDILIVSAFTNGGTVANIQVYKVIQTNGNGSNPNAVAGTCPATAFDGYAGKSTGATGICLQQLITQSTPGVAACNSAITGPPAVPADAACAATNAGEIDALDPRFLSSQSGSVKGKYPALTFFEVGLNLDDLGLTTECFPNYIVEGRQSQSVTAALNDFTIGAFQSCEVGITTTATASVIVGNPISDTAHLTGSGAVPGGTITFKAYASLAACQAETPVAFTSSPITVNGFGDYNSGNFTPTATGTYYWVASYSGDGNFPGASTSCGDSGESSVVGPASPAITTTASAGVAIGGTITDTAHLTGGFGTLTGSITFSLYRPGDTNCTQTAIFTSTKTVNGAGNYTSDAYTTAVPFGAGTYRWIAAYTSGDTNNNSATTACNDANESVVVVGVTPSLSTAPTVKVIHNDSATLTGGASPTGTLTFKLYQNTTCTGTPAFTTTRTVSGNGTYTSADSQQFTVSADTEFRWTVEYTSGDSNNNNVGPTACSAEGVKIDITP